MTGSIAHDLTQLWLHVRDVSVSALAAAVLTLGVVLLMELRCVVRLRHSMDSNLARVFEQLDLLRFETQQLLEGQQLARTSQPALPAVAAAAASAPVTSNPAAGAMSRAAPVATAATTAATAVATAGAAIPVAVDLSGAAPGRVSAGEARLLSSLAQARARRAQAAGA